MQTPSILLIVVVALASAASEAQEQADPIRVVSVTGVDSNAHNWKERSQAISQILADKKKDIDQRVFL